ncbi:hypothetical protein PV327_011241, partial [Microctonus hyperodae]
KQLHLEKILDEEIGEYEDLSSSNNSTKNAVWTREATLEDLKDFNIQMTEDQLLISCLPQFRLKMLKKRQNEETTSTTENPESKKTKFQEASCSKEKEIPNNSSQSYAKSVVCDKKKVLFANIFFVLLQESSYNGDLRKIRASCKDPGSPQ